MNFRKYIFLLSVFFVMQCAKIFAHEGEDHGVKKPSATTQSASHFTSFAVSDKFEVVIYYGEIEADEETEMTIFLSDFATNTPINKANLDISIANETSKKFIVTQTDSGIYKVKGIFPANKIYSLTANISAGNRADLMLIKNIEAGKKLPVAEEINAEENHEDSKEISPILYALGGLVLGGLIIWLLMSKRRKIGN